MDFFEGNLNQNLLFRGKPHWISLIPSVIRMAIIIGVFMIIKLWIEATIGPIPHATLTIVILGILTIIRPLIEMLTTELRLTPQRLIGKVGLINTTRMDVQLNKINNVTIENGLMGKIFGYGTILVTTSSGSFFYPHIAQAKIMHQAIADQIAEFNNDRMRQQAREMAEAMRGVAATK